MERCPHCQADAIPTLAKAWSGSGSPLTCARCGGASYVPSMSFAFHALKELMLLAALVSAFLLWHWWPVALYTMALGGWLYWLAKRAPLVAASASQAIRNRRYGLLAVVAFFVLVLAAGFFTH